MNAIDLSLLPAPDVVQPLDFEATLAELKAQFIAYLPELADVIELESEPAHKLLQLFAYEKVNMQARINDSARACMLAYALGADLDNLCALLGMQRLQLSAGDAGANPPIAPTWEDDARLRTRAQMALEGATVAGSRGSYVFHALSASARVRDVAISSPAPGDVLVTVLSTDAQGVADAELLQTVHDYLSAEARRPLTDTVLLEPAELVEFQVHAVLHFYPGPSAANVVDAALAKLAEYLQGARLGYDITRSGLYAALHQSGVRQVELIAPTGDVIVGPRQAAQCTAVQVLEGGRDV